MRGTKTNNGWIYRKHLYSLVSSSWPVSERLAGLDGNTTDLNRHQLRNSERSLACKSTFLVSTQDIRSSWVRVMTLFLRRSWDLRNLRKTDSSSPASSAPATTMAVSKLAVYARRFPIVPSMITYSVLYPTANLLQQYCFRKSTAETGIDWREVSRSVQG